MKVLITGASGMLGSTLVDKWKDIYDIFPNLRRTFIPDSVTLPDSVLKNGLKGFVDSLEQRFATSANTDL